MGSQSNSTENLSCNSNLTYNVIAKDEYNAGGVEAAAGKDCSPIFRSSLAADGFDTNAYLRKFLADTYNVREAPHLTMWELMRHVKNSIGDRPCFYSRKQRLDGSWAPYASSSYRTIFERVKTVGAGLLALNLVEYQDYDEHLLPSARRLRILAVCSRNQESTTLVSLAAHAFDFTTTVLYETLGDESIEHIVKICKIRTICAGYPNMKFLLPILQKLKEELGEQFMLRNIVLIDYRNHPNFSDIKTQYAAIGVRVYEWVEILEAGVQHRDTQEVIAKPDSVSCICFTSGTSGVPKGAMLTERMLVATISGALRFLQEQFDHLQLDDGYITYLSHLPMAHVYERFFQCCILVMGAQLYFHCGERERFIDDVRDCRPVIFASVPRVFEKLMSTVEDKLNQRALTRWFFRNAYTRKLEHFEKTGKLRHPILDTLLFKKIQKAFGGRVAIFFSGGSMISANLQRKFNMIFGVPFLNAYGLTETMGPTFSAHAVDREVGHIGGTFAHISFRLHDVPEMNYFANGAKSQGELAIRGEGVFPGYFCNEEASRECFDEEGFFHTGDIAEISDGNRVRIIDRKKNLFKLSQGEYVSSEKVETIMTLTPGVAQCYVHGLSTQSYVVGLIVLEEGSVIRGFAKQLGVPNASLRSLIKDHYNALKPLVAAALQASAVTGKLKGFERVRDFVMIDEQFTVENELLTPTMKLRRMNLRTRYGAMLEALYKI